MILVAEIGPANGDLAYAFDAVIAAKESGFHAVKGQIYDRDKLVTRTARTYAHDLQLPDTQYEDFSRQLTYTEWADVAAECERAGIEFFASVFDHGAVEFCETLDVKRYKIASGDITYEQLIRHVADTGKEVVVSTGGSTGPEIARALKWIPGPVTLLACTMSYPCLDKDAHLNRMLSLRDLLAGQFRQGAVGYSDHTFSVGAMVRAYQLGAQMIEKHFTIDPGAGGDHGFAITPATMEVFWNYKDQDGGQIYEGRAALEPVEAERKALKGARRSMHAARDLVAGTMLHSEDVAMLRPDEGLQPFQLDTFIGRPLRNDRAAGQPIRAEDF